MCVEQVGTGVWTLGKAERERGKAGIGTGVWTLGKAEREREVRQGLALGSGPWVREREREKQGRDWYWGLDPG